MLLSTKRRVIQYVLLALAIWPLCHVVVVRVVGLNPWKGAGWAMYCVPELKISFELESQRGASQPTPKQSEMVRQELERFSLRYRALGGLARPDRLAETVFRVNPEARTIRIRVAQRTVDRETALIAVRRTDQYDYARP